MAILLDRKKEKEFFYYFSSFDTLNKKGIVDDMTLFKAVLHTLDFMNGLLEEVKDEVRNNLLLLPEKHARFSYLKVLYLRIEEVKTKVRSAVEALDFGIEAFLEFWTKEEPDFYITDSGCYIFIMSMNNAAGGLNDFILSILKEQDDKLNEEDAYDEVKFKHQTQKLAWMYELGIVQVIMEIAKENGSHNPTKAAKLISSFTDLKPETVKKILQAIYTSVPGNHKNNPLKSAATRLFIQEMREMYKLSEK